MEPHATAPAAAALRGKVALVTGASSGIGAETARALASLGMRVALTARRADRLDDLAEDIPAGAAFTYPGDITDHAFIDDLMARVPADLGSLDVVVNNAGMLTSAPFDEIDIDKACAMVRLNVEAAYRVTFLALRRFKAQGHGHLVNVSSVLGTKVRANYGAYAGTKFAIEALSEGLRMELAGTRIRLTVIEPGLVMTELHDEFPEHPSQTLRLEKALEPADIARAIVYALAQPAHVNIARLMALPSDQAT
jgi:NADP-dependent 3-hydroxy acid dehydrogenase YdfG